MATNPYPAGTDKAKAYDAGGAGQACPSYADTAHPNKHAAWVEGHAVWLANQGGGGTGGNVTFNPAAKRQTMMGFGGSVGDLPMGPNTAPVRLKLLDYGASYLRVLFHDLAPGPIGSAADWVFTDWVNPMRAAVEARGEKFSLLVDAGGSGMNGMSPATYAQVCVEFLKHIKALGGPEPDHWAIKNEPDNGKQLTPQQVAAYAKAAVPAMRAAGFNAVKLSTPMLMAGQNVVAYLKAAIAAGLQPSWIGVVSYHNYAGMTTAQRTTLRLFAESLGLPTEMNEHNKGTWTECLDDIANGGAAAWMKNGMAGAHLTNPWITTAGGGLGVDTAGFNYLWVIHRHVRPGMAYIPATCTDAKIKPYLFQAPGGATCVVAQCSGAAQISVGGLPPGTYYPHYTTATQSKVTGTGITVTAGQVLTFSMPAAGLLALSTKQ